MEKTIGVENNGRAAEDGQLVADARSNPAAFAQLYRRHYDYIFRYCVHRFLERQTAEDVTSAVFLKVVENLRHFRGTERQFRNWLYKIATNAVNDYLRRAARQISMLKVVAERVNSQTADCGHATDENTEKLAFLKQAMLTLKPKYQTIITLRFFENLKLTEIAEVLGSRPATVRSQLARALAGLRKKIVSAHQREV